MRNIVEINALSEYRLECLFSDGTRKTADIKPFLGTEAFKPLLDIHVFSSMLVNRIYFVEWKNLDIDLSADTLWHISKED